MTGQLLCDHERARLWRRERRVFWRLSVEAITTRDSSTVAFFAPLLARACLRSRVAGSLLSLQIVSRWRSGSPSQVKCNQRSIVAVRRIFFCSSSTP